jgi:hypothetical protein
MTVTILRLLLEILKEWMNGEGKRVELQIHHSVEFKNYTTPRWVAVLDG